MNKRNFLRTSIALIVAKLLTPFKSYSAMHQKQNSNWSSFKISQIDRERTTKGGPYLSFLNEKTLKTGLYVLAKGSVDKQNPHELDEVYYIIKGRAKFFVDDETIDANEGDVIYVKARIEHRFLDIEEDLKILVFFSEKKPA